MTATQAGGARDTHHAPRDAGLVVALVGPDGAGKTTVARRLEDALDRPVTYLYMGVNAEASDRLLPTTRLIERFRRGRRGGRQRVTTGHGATRQRRRGPVRRVLGAVGLVNRMAEELNRLRLARRWRREGRIVVLDRDFLLDYHATDLAGGQRSLGRRLHGLFLRRVYRRPDLVVYLDAPPEVLFARKGEGTLEWLAQRRADYHAALDLVARRAIVDATQPLDAVVAEVARIVSDAAGPTPVAGGGR